MKTLNHEIFDIFLNYWRRCPLSLTEHCDYRYQLEGMLRYRLVYGIKHERIQQHLLNEGDSLTLQRALDIAHSMESAIHPSSSMMRWAYWSNPKKVEEVQKIALKQNLKCYCCNRRRKGYDYPFKSKECYICRKKGYIAKVCRSKSVRNNRETNLEEEIEKQDLDEDWETSKSSAELMQLSIQWKSLWKSMQGHQLVL